MQYNDTLETMVGQVRRVKPTAPPDLVKDFLNARMRTVINRRPYWAGLLKRVVISIPSVYNVGSIATTFGSNVVLGTNTAWPVNDVVSTILPEGVVTPGVQWVTPASMQNIDANSVLYVDDGGTFPEIVPVRQVNQTQFKAKFNFPHDQNCQVWMSSLVNLQFRVTIRNPIYSILAVTSPGSLVLDNPWGAAAQAGAAYQILKMYVHVGDDVKQLLAAKDPLLGIQLECNVSQARVNAYDPYRAATQNPWWVCDNYRNACDNMTYELYPPPTSARQLDFYYYQEWPKMVGPQDPPPPFLDPSILVYGAMADVLRLKMTADDSNVNPQAANLYEQKFEAGVNDLVTADNSKAQMQFDWDYVQGYGFGGASFWQKHDPDVLFGWV